MRKPFDRLTVVSFLFATAAAVMACGGTNGTSSGTGASTASGGSGGTGGTGGSGATSTGAFATGGGGAGGMGGMTTTSSTTSTPTQSMQSIKSFIGDATWQVTFDDTAKAAGAKDCSYTRHYDAVEDRSAKWLCPTCEIMFRAKVQVTAGLADCYSQVSKNPPATDEWIGYGNGTYFRSAGGPTTQQGTAMVNGDKVVVANQVMDLDASVGGKMAFAVSGNFTLGDTMGDPMNGFTPPATYACGWPKADPPPYAGDYVLKKGAVLPDGVFLDSCSEPVRLHDFKGKYLIVDMSAMDCPPCQTMASEEEKLISDMASKGVDVAVITLLCPSLSDVFGTTTKKNIDTWTSKFKLKSAVLADRGWGVSEFEPAVGAMNLGYPTWVVVRPDLTVVDFMTGYGSYTDIENVILADKK
jgi:thiol-disulfide isomerase/thioredoxin